MSETTFALPESMPYLDYKSLRTYVGHRNERKIGTVVNIQRGGDGAAVFDFRLGFTLFAVIYENEVQFLYHREMTTEQTAWMERLAEDNGIDPRAAKLQGNYPACPLQRKIRPKGNQ